MIPTVLQLAALAVAIYVFVLGMETKTFQRMRREEGMTRRPLRLAAAVVTWVLLWEATALIAGLLAYDLLTLLFHDTLMH